MTDNPELVAIQRRLVMLKRDKLNAIRNNGLAYYQPHAKQKLFHEAGLTCNRRMVRAGNRFGKSTMGCAEDVAWLLGERLWLPESDSARRGGIPQHPIKLLTITTDWDKVDEIWTGQRGDSPGKVWRYLPARLVKSSKRNHSGAIDTIELTNGSIWRFDTVKSFLANPQGSESSDWDAIHVDEPCPEQMFKASARGLIDRNGSAWFTLTPLSEFWINDYFFPQDTGGLPRTGVWSIFGSIYDNPYLPKAAIDQFLSSLTDDERQCRAMGIPMHLTGLIYKEFSFATHVLQKLPQGWTNWNNPPADYTIYYAIDTHPRTPHAVLFLAVSPLNQQFFFYDIFKHCRISELAHDIKQVLAGRYVAAGKLEPAAWIEDPVDDRTMADEFFASGLNVEKAVKDLKGGILAVKAALRTEPQTVFFSPECRRTLWEIQRYAWDAETDKPLDVDDHMMECMYRLERCNPHWIDIDKASGVAVDEIVIDRPEINTQDLSFNLD